MGTRHGGSAGREGGWYHSVARDTRHHGRSDPPHFRGDRHHRWPRRRGAVGRRDPVLVALQPDARLTGRARLGHDRRRRHRRSVALVSPRPGRSSQPRSCCSADRGHLLRHRAPAYVRRAADRQGLDRGTDRRDRGRRRGGHRGRARRSVGVVARLMLAVIAVGVVLSTLEPGRTDVAAGDFDVVIDAIDDRRPWRSLDPRPDGGGPGEHADRYATGDAPRDRWRRCSSGSGSSLPAGRPRSCRSPGGAVGSPRRPGRRRHPARPPGRLRLTRVALPLVVLAGAGEVLGSMLSAWGSRESIPVTAVMGSQFAAIAAVAAFLLFGERLGRRRSPASSSSSSASRSLPP